ncbi:hypothetical protein [Pleomorphomonas sp. PLEO]|uniref:hypothetical protein n=1 Tax=Pleomorphomonas sp. PLEO TaxID=3239306 RepID=UPI00351F791B
MTGQIELIAFMGLRTLFSERGWPIPRLVDLPEDMTGEELLHFLAIESAKVEALIVNRSAIAVEDAVIHPGDRVTLVPPGVPGPHRLLLGIHGQTKPAQPFGLSFPAVAEKDDGDEGNSQ